MQPNQITSTMRGGFPLWASLFPLLVSPAPSTNDELRCAVHGPACFASLLQSSSLFSIMQFAMLRFPLCAAILAFFLATGGGYPVQSDGLAFTAAILISTSGEPIRMLPSSSSFHAVASRFVPATRPLLFAPTRESALTRFQLPSWRAPPWHRTC